MTRRKSYQLDFNNPTLSVGIQENQEGNLEFMIHTGSEWVYIDFDFFPEMLKVMKELELVNDPKTINKTNNLSKELSIKRTKRHDSYNDFNIQIQLLDTTYTIPRIEGNVTLHGIEQLKRVRESFEELHEKYLYDKWLDEKIKSEGVQYVEYDGKKYTVKNGVLNLHSLGIKNITDIKGLEKINYLKSLSLYDNNIEEIEGLNHFTHLENLTLNRNYIREIKGLENLINLKVLGLNENPISELKGVRHLKNLTSLQLTNTKIPKTVLSEIGLHDHNQAKEAIENLNLKIEEQRNLKEVKLKVKAKTIDYIKKASSAFEEITFEKIISKTGVHLDDLEDIVEDLIFTGAINAKIRKNGIAFLEESPLVDLAIETVDVLKGIKDDTELISQYTSLIEDVFDQTENIEEFLKLHLASEFEKIRDAWRDYKEGIIDKKELIKVGIKQIGKKFIKIFLKK